MEKLFWILQLWVTGPESMDYRLYHNWRDSVYGRTLYRNVFLRFTKKLLIVVYYLFNVLIKASEAYLTFQVKKNAKSS
jgi:hypothetical protein